jgi:prepilin-type N-terminal cleavage/methylation domain-containing protein
LINYTEYHIINTKGLKEDIILNTTTHKKQKYTPSKHLMGAPANHYCKRLLSHFKEVFKRPAFTLAEILIVIGVVGIIAAITLPTLIQRAREKATIAKVKETYSILTQAYKHAEEEYGTPEGWYTGTGGMYDQQSHIDMATPMKKFMKLSADCVGKTEEYTATHCNSTNYISKSYSSVKLLNGVSVVFRTWAGACNWSYASKYKSNTCGSITIFLEPDKTVKTGENQFAFYLTREGIVPYGMNDSALTFEKACNKSISNPYPNFSSINMFSCTAWVIYKENMDYLRCDDLSWTGKSTCK